MAAEAVLTFAAEGILKKVLSLAEKELSLAWGFKAELRKLQGSFNDIQLLLNDAAHKPQAPAIEKWVKELKGIAEDAEDVLDEFKYEVDRRKVEIQNHMKRKVLNFFSLSNPLAFRLQMAHKIQKINASLVDLERKASPLVPLALVSRNTDATSQGIRWDRQTNAFFGKDEIPVGRKADVSKIVTTLTDSKYSKENLAVMAIVGMGGLGKTTLAKSVYNEDSIHKFFEKKIWICVSDTFDVNIILLQILESLNSAKAPSKDNQNAILTNLQVELKDKRYLLVLDDVWNEDKGKWEHLVDCLSKLNSSGGSKIIVTTRSGNVASIAEKLLPTHELEKLSVDECWSIMKDRAFPSSSAHIAPEFQKIGREIAENCGGVPLVAKVLGGILLTKRSIEEWSSFKNNEIWNNQSKEKDRIMSVLRLSFDNLESPSLKQCFAYCSMFEKDFEIQRDNLIQLWMAQGLLRASHDGSKDMEDTGNEYFDILLQSSLFQDATMGDNGIVTECKMHDLVHDLAKDVSKSDSLMGGLCGRDNTLEFRHVARVSTSTLENITARSARKLRSLFSDNGEVPANILPQFKALRVLNLWNANIGELPVSVGRLKHLRYLDISKTRFKALPKSVGKLYNLQTLRAVNCALEEFPKELQNLINLRHIYFDEDIKFPQGIGRLTCLRTLPYFPVGNEIGRRIEELAGLKQLKGELIVCNLEHVKNGEEAKKAKLDKMKVRHVSFNWTEDRSTTNNNVEEDVLEGLRPHLELESLSIENFMGDKFPTWMMSGLLNNLKKIKLTECNKCEVVPPLGHLPNLTELIIRGMANLKCVGAEFYGYDLVHNVATTSEEIITLFPALKVLYIFECGDLNEWKQAPTMSRKKVVVFPCLEKLTVKNCCKLRNAPSHFPFLQKLEMSSCDSRTPIEEMSNGLTTLTSLEISGIKELTCLPPGILKKNNNLHSLVIKNCDDLTCITPDVVGSCSSLKGLVISNCKSLRHLAYGLDTLPLLEELTIKGCPSLELIQIEQGMASLQKLNIRGCGRLSHLPSGLKYCTSLQQLSIESCDGLSGPLSLWASLVEVSIENCNNLTSIEIKGSGSLADSLLILTICDCGELSSIPALPQQCPSLQELEIGGCPKLSSFGVKSSRAEKEEECISLQSTSDLRTMTSLGLLRIGNCERLESWVSSLQFPLSLEMLSIHGMPNLHILPSLDHLHSLRTLWIENCERLESWVSSLQFPLSLEDLSIDDMPNLHILPSLDHLHSLCTLSIVNWRNLKYLPTGLQWPTGLQTLSIGGFWEELDSFPDFEVGSLMHLTLYGWPKLKSLPQQIQHLTSLTSLWICSFEGVETLPEWLGSLTSLTLLRIDDCKNLKNLPSVQSMQRLTKLQFLDIIRCHPLLKERCRRNSGTDWPKISHIPRIRIELD